MTWLPLIFSLVVSLLYSYPLPGIYAVRDELIITAECGCEFRDIEPVENVAHEIRQITPWMTGITFDEPGIITGLGISCPKSVVDDYPVDKVKVDWMIR